MIARNFVASEKLWIGKVCSYARVHVWLVGWPSIESVCVCERAPPFPPCQKAFENGWRRVFCGASAHRRARRLNAVPLRRRFNHSLRPLIAGVVCGQFTERSGTRPARRPNPPRNRTPNSPLPNWQQKGLSRRKFFLPPPPSTSKVFGLVWFGLLQYSY